MEDTFVGSMRYRRAFGCGKPGYARISKESTFSRQCCWSYCVLSSYVDYRWLIDTDKDDEGLRIIADLHGGDLDNPVAKAEYREIKDKVILEVRLIHLFWNITHSSFSGNSGKEGPME